MQNNQQNDIFSMLSKLSKADNSQKRQAAEKLMSSMSNEESREFQKLISDKDKVSQILSSPAVQQIMQKLNGQHK